MGYQKICRSGNFLEIYEYQKDLPVRKSRKKTDRIKYRGSSSRRADNVARLKRDFTRLVRANLVGDTSPAFFTFTMVEVVRIELAYRFFTEFVQRFRRLYGKHTRYIAVPEFQERGAVHFHVLWWGLPKELIENETPKKQIVEGVVSEKRGDRAIQHVWGRGFVDCVSTDGSPKLAFYLAKYMQKTLQDDRLYRQKSYTCSRNVLRKVSFKTKTSAFHALEAWGVDLSTTEPLLEKRFDTYWLGKGRYRCYLLNP